MSLPNIDVNGILTPYKAPRNQEPTSYTCWERAGVNIGDLSEGLDSHNWFVEYNPVTGDVTYSRAGLFPQIVHTLVPGLTEVQGSFDVNMLPVVVYRTPAGLVNLLFYDLVAADYVTLPLAQDASSVKVALDDVRQEQFELGGTDTVVAYSVFGSLFCRLGREDYAVEHLVAGGFSTIRQIGMNEENRFQITRDPFTAADDVSTYLPSAEIRAGHFVGFDAAGDAALWEPLPLSQANPPVRTVRRSITASGRDVLPSSGSSSFTARFLTESSAVAADLQVDWYADNRGNISHEVGPSDSGTPLVLQAQARGSAGTVFYKDPVSLAGGYRSAISIIRGRTWGRFAPEYNPSGGPPPSFPGGGLTPIGHMLYVDTGGVVSLTLDQDEPDNGFLHRSFSAYQYFVFRIPAQLWPSGVRRVFGSIVLNNTRVPAEFSIGSTGFVTVTRFIVRTGSLPGYFGNADWPIHSDQVEQIKGLAGEADRSWSLTYPK